MGMNHAAADLGLELERVARRDPDAPALSGPGVALTYGQMLSAARELAATLPPTTSNPSRPVALAMPHDPGSVVAIVAALLGGRPYCALDPEQPRRRLEDLLGTIEPELVWASDAALRVRLRAIGHEAQAPLGAPARTPARERTPAAQDDACAIFLTSGSSGAPKAVRYLHRPTVHRARRYAEAIHASETDVFSLASPLWVAASASGLFAALLRGSRVHLLAPGALGPSALAGEIAAAGITIWHSTPSLFRRLCASGGLAAGPVRAIRLGGEAVRAGDIRLARGACPPATLLVTGYSLTEANGAVTQKVVPLDSPEAAAADAGTPLDGIELAVEGPDGRTLPPGEEGEITVGGVLLAGGYAAEEQPAARGTRYAERDAARVLLTGDLGVLRADGALEVRGRNDDRLKIRGHRVDPGEVQADALGHDRVAEAAVIPFAVRPGHPAVALFAVPEPGPGPLTTAELDDHLEAALPAEARPALVRVLPELPLTPSGKVDREQLARIAREGGGASRRGPERLDAVVSHLLALWREALEVEEVGPDHDFLALGGDSLAAVEVCAGIEAVYGQSMEPATLLRHRTPRELGKHIQRAVAGTLPAAGPVLRLNPAGGRPPLFCVPGAGSEATALVHMAAALGPEQPLNVIQLPGADGRSRPLTRMDRIAAHCVAAIRESGVGPPYRIAGTSFGGVVAYTIAARLEGDGEEVEYVGLFDTPMPARRRRNQLIEPLRRFRRPPGLTAGSLGRSPRAELGRLRGPLRNLRVNYRITLSLLLGLPWRPPAELRFRHLRAACLIAAGRWTPPADPVRCHLYRCESQPEDLDGLPYLGWEAQAPEIELRSLPTGHGGHIRPPGVRHLAALVGDDLAASRGRQPAAAR